MSVCAPPETISLNSTAGVIYLFFFLLPVLALTVSDKLNIFTAELSKFAVWAFCSEAHFLHVINDHKRFTIVSHRHKALGKKKQKKKWLPGRAYITDGVEEETLRCTLRSELN